MNERDLIALLRPLTGSGALNLDDDVAIIAVPDGHDLVVSEDMMVEGVHFPAGRIGAGFSERLLRTALSDLAAKGATATGYMLSVAWPKGRDPDRLLDFVTGLANGQSAFVCYLLGGDTTSTNGPLVASATVYGLVRHGMMVRRSGAQPGDQVWHTGQLGLAETGLAIISGKAVALPAEELRAAKEAYLRPQPRFEFGPALRRYASACADISDGILIEASYIAGASQVKLNLRSEALVGAEFGDDYELLFTASPQNERDLKKAAREVGLELTLCGDVVAGEGVAVDGSPVDPTGYSHQL